MIAQVRAELLKQVSIRTGSALLVTEIGMVVLAVTLHTIGLPVAMLEPQRNQLMVVGVGARLGVLFAALFGAIAVTMEYRHGTIRSTLLIAPRRWQLIVAKALVAALAGVLVAGVGTAIGAGWGAVLLPSRGVSLAISGADVLTLLAGGAVAGGLWAIIGVGIGAVVRNQVPAIIGLAAWLLFIEGLLAEEASSVVAFGKYGPGAAATALSGLGADALLDAGPALLVLTLYAIGAIGIGIALTQRRDLP